jgi:hypothetical protein
MSLIFRPRDSTRLGWFVSQGQAAWKAAIAVLALRLTVPGKLLALADEVIE